MSYTCSFQYIIYVFGFIPMHLSSTFSNMLALLYNLRVYIQLFALVGRDESKTSFILQERIFVYLRVFVQ